MGWDEDERARVIEEANVAFRLNADLFAELDEATSTVAA